MGMVSAKFSGEEDQKLEEICEKLRIDKSEALRRATRQLWLALQIGKPFVERAGGRPQFLLNSGNPNASTRKLRKAGVDSYVRTRAQKRKQSTHSPGQESQ